MAILKRTIIVFVFAVLLSVTSWGQEAELPPDYYDGLRLWDNGEKEIAAALWSEAASSGDFRSQRKLSKLYETGDVLPQNNSLSYFWIAIASRDHPEILDDLTKIRDLLTDEDIAEVEKAAKDWKRVEPTGLAAGALSNEVSSESLNKASSTEPLELLRVAAMQGDLEAARQLVAGGTSPSIQDTNGVWPHQIAEAAGNSELASYLSNETNIQLAPIKSYLHQMGYLEEQDFMNVVRRRPAIIMYQQSAPALTVSGILDRTTFNSIAFDSAEGTPRNFALLIRWTVNGSDKYLTFEGKHSTVAQAREAAMAKCLYGVKCKFNFAPTGGCIAIARASNDKLRSSTLQISEPSAKANALLQCKAIDDKCDIEKVICAK